MNDLEEVYSTDQFVPITFYWSGEYSIPGGITRRSWYGFNGTPSAVFDGVEIAVGGGGSTTFDYYEPRVINRLGQSSPLIIDAEFTAIGNSISLSADIVVDEAITDSDNKLVYIFVCQEGYHGQSNMAVDMLPTEGFTLDTPGQSTTITRNFELDAQFNVDDLRVVVLVQNTSTKEILQTTLAHVQFAGTLVVDIDPDGANAPWQLTGPDGFDLTGSGDTTLPLYFTGEYTLTFLDIPMWTMPANNPQVQTLVQDGMITFTGLFSDGPFAAVTTGPISNTGVSMGSSLVDFDNDGDLDIHVVNDGSVDQLLRNDGSLSFTDVAAGLVADTGAGSCGAWADFNQDGNLDLLLGRNGESNVLMVGDGFGGFSLVNTMGLEDVDPTASISVADHNMNGILDIYMTNVGQANRMLQSSGEVGPDFFFFSPITGEFVSSSHSNGVNWIDLNSDQLPDLYLANGPGTNALFSNSTYGYFEETSSSNTGNTRSSIGSTWGDYDNDGDLDLFVSNEGNADQLYKNIGIFQFEVVYDAITSDEGNGRGALWADFNNDTNLDLYIVRYDETDLFLLGDGLGGFTSVPIGPVEANGPGNAVACGDIDQDGDIDLFITREGESNVLLENIYESGNNFFELTLIGSEEQPDAIGAVVLLTTGSITQRRQISCGSGYLSMNSSTMHFGLGDATMVDEIEIIWPNGDGQILNSLAVNQFMEVTKGDVSPVDEGQALPKATVLGKAHPNPFNPSTTIGFALAKSGPTRLDIFTVDGRCVKNLVSEDLAAGHHDVIWTGKDNNGRTVASGTYFYRLNAADGSQQTGRMALVK